MKGFELPERQRKNMSVGQFGQAPASSSDIARLCSRDQDEQ